MREAIRVIKGARSESELEMRGLEESAETLAPTKPRILLNVIIPAQVTSATEGRMSKSLGQRGRKNSSPKWVVLYTLNTSPAVPRMVIAERRERTLMPKPIDEMMLDCFGWRVDEEEGVYSWRDGCGEEEVMVVSAFCSNILASIVRLFCYGKMTEI